MGITPIISGVPKSCMGTAARSAMMQRQDQFRRFQLSNLPFAHEADANNDQEIQNDGADDGGHHRPLPFCAATLCPSVSQGNAIIPGKIPPQDLSFPRQGVK